VQFVNGDGSVDTFFDDITLLTTIDGPDEEAPTITSTRVSASRSTSRTIAATATTKYVLKITSRDKLSGVNRIQTRIGTKISTIKVDPSRLATHSIKFPPGKSSMYVRVIDVAGNASPWKKVKTA
jgi:hypothetical protein